jgi:hypothetical protein
MFGKVAEILGISTSPGLISCESASRETVVRNVKCHGYQVDSESEGVTTFGNTCFPNYRGTMRYREGDGVGGGVWAFMAEKI